MKLKHLFALAAMAACGTTWAQTDVTSEYLTNADFEGNYSALEGTGVTKDRAIYQPEGWTITNIGTFNENDMTVLKSGDPSYSNFTGITALDGGGIKPISIAVSGAIRPISKYIKPQLCLKETTN